MEKDFKKYANSFQAIARLGLESITELMNILGNPQDDLKFIHIAGTNGKGSVCCYLQNILKNAGYKCGKYTSPNMINVNERININGVDISDPDLSRLLEKVQKAAELVERNTTFFPTQFEIWTAVAFCYFKEMNCDIVILETGLGGERDATNIIKNPLISVITRIATDHTEYLGNTIEDITNAKCGIIKENSNGFTVTINQDEKILNIIENSAKTKKNTLVIAKYPKIFDYNGINERFSYGSFEEIEISMRGINQIENATIAIECSKILKIDEKYIRKGLLESINIGRFEKLSDEPLIIIDGAHNQNGMNSLAQNLVRYYPNKKTAFIMAFMKDKDIENALFELKKNNLHKNSKVFTVKVKNNPRAMDSSKLAELLNSNGFLATPCNDLSESFTLANKYELTVICGSLYLYKDVIEYLNTQKGM